MKILSIGYKSADQGGPFNVEQNYIKVLQRKNIEVVRETYTLKKIFKILMLKKNFFVDYINEFDLVHFHAVFSISNALISKLLFKNHIPYIISLHGNLNNWSMNQSKLKKLIFLKFFQSYILKSQAIHVLNDFEKNEVSNTIDLKKLRTFKLQNCIDVPKYKITKSSSKVKFTVLFFGRLNLKKGIYRLLNIIKLLKKNSINDIKFLFVGPKDLSIYKDFLSKIESLKLTKIIEIRDSVQTLEDKKKLFSECDIFILPSDDEADSVSLKEALSAGLPVIISKNCKFEFTKDAIQFVKVIDNNDLNHYVDAILEFYKNYQNLNSLAIKAHTYSRLHFSLKEIEVFLPEIYYDCLTYSFKSKNWYS